MSNVKHLTEVRFGRNINGTPMGAEDWETFQESVRSFVELLVRDEKEEWVELHLSARGSWQGESEEAAVVTLYHMPYGSAVIESRREMLRAFAADQARVFEQESVAVVIAGVSELVSAEVAS